MVFIHKTLYAKAWYLQVFFASLATYKMRVIYEFLVNTIVIGDLILILPCILLHPCII